ncbi:MAG TPA: hypothetical protein VJV79_04760 [Polyangiaceae bacterium]|nr:hypothetical protein [Polyangiaceae bacterium]
MRHLFTFVVSGAIAALSLMGCGSDDSSPNGGSPSQCVGGYDEFSATEFQAETEPGKACSSASDATTVCTNDMPIIGGQCGKGCLGMSDEAECVPACIQDSLASGSAKLSQDCLACYTANIECAKANCLLKCGADPASIACSDCRRDSGCAGTFYSCSGLPEPVSP